MFSHPFHRRSLSALAATGCLLVAGLLVTSTPDRPDDDLPDPEAMALLGDGRQSSEEIVLFWQERVAAAPEVARNHTGLAGAQLTLAGDRGDLAGYEASEQTALMATSLAPDDDAAVLTLAAAKAGQHQFTASLLLVDEVLAGNPDSVDAILSAGDALLALGDYDKAREHFGQAAAQVGDLAPILSRQARLEAEVGRLSNARHLAKRALIEAAGVDLRHADAAFYWFQLASYEFALGDAEAAELHLRAALQIDPENAGAFELLGRVLTAQGDYAGAVEVYEDLVDGGGAADLHGELAKLYRHLGRDADADLQISLGLAAAAEAADLYPAERRHLIGFLADHDPIEAKRLAELDLSERQDVRAHSWYAWTLFQTGDVPGAVAAMQPALDTGTDDARLLYQAGAIHLAAGNKTTARTLLQESLALNPGFDLVHAAEARRLLASLSA